jgi:hypothetical protein
MTCIVVLFRAFSLILWVISLSAAVTTSARERTAA